MNPPAFQGFAIGDLSPCSFIEQTITRSGSVKSNVVAQKELFPLRNGDVVFDAGSPLSFGAPRIRAVGVVLVGKKRSSMIYVLEAAPGHYHQAGTVYNLADWQTWLADSAREKRYTVTEQQRAKCEEAAKLQRKRKRDAVK